MKDIKRLNDKLDLDVDLSAVEVRVAGLWNDCHLATICIFPGQFGSDLPKPGQTVFHHNLKLVVIPSEPTIFIDARETAGLCASCDKSVACLGVKCAITRANSEIDALADDFVPEDGEIECHDDDDIHFHGPDSAVTDLLNTCDDCEDASPDCCDGCLLSSMTLAEYAEGDDESDTGSKEPDVFDKLKDEHWNMLCRWTLAAAECHAQRDFKDGHVNLCRISGDCCTFEDCPRVHDA
jgi:hypothetical protein